MTACKLGPASSSAAIRARNTPATRSAESSPEASRASRPTASRAAISSSVARFDGGLAVPFDVVSAGQTCRAFAIRFRGRPQAYLNRCTHVAMELDWQPNRIFDDTGNWLLCSTHGAAYHPDTGAYNLGAQ